MQESPAVAKEDALPVAYLGGHGAMPPWPDHENILQAILYEKVRFLPFSSKNCKIQQRLMVFCVSKFQKNGRICGSIEHSEAKSVSASGGGLGPPDPSTRGSAPGPRCPTARYSLCSSCCSIDLQGHLRSMILCNMKWRMPPPTGD